VEGLAGGQGDESKRMKASPWFRRGGWAERDDSEREVGRLICE
jgi:hypothetical protein